jgi:hypothetical protein
LQVPICWEHSLLRASSNTLCWQCAGQRVPGLGVRVAASRGGVHRRRQKEEAAMDKRTAISCLVAVVALAIVAYLLVQLFMLLFAGT